MGLHLEYTPADLETIERVRLEDRVVSVLTRSAGPDGVELEMLLDLSEAKALRDGLDKALSTAVVES